MPNIVVSQRATAARLQRKPWLRSVQGLNLTLLVHAEHQRFVGGIQIQPDNIVEFLHKLLVSAQLERAGQMRFEVVSRPNALNGRLAELLRLRHAARAPMRGVGRLGVQGGFHHSAHLGLRKFRPASRPWRILLQAGQSQSQEPFAPQLHRRARNSQFSCDLLTEYALRRHRDNARSHHLPVGQLSGSPPSLQRGLFFHRQRNRICCSHAPYAVKPRPICNSIYNSPH